MRRAPRPRGRRTQSAGAPCRASPTQPRPPPTTPRDREHLLGVGPGLGGHGGSPLAGTSKEDDNGVEEGREPQPQAGPEEEEEEDASRDSSSFDSDSDAFSSPCCLSPVSAALADGGGSVFLEEEEESR